MSNCISSSLGFCLVSTNSPALTPKSWKRKACNLTWRTIYSITFKIENRPPTNFPTSMHFHMFTVYISCSHHSYTGYVSFLMTFASPSKSQTHCLSISMSNTQQLHPWKCNTPWWCHNASSLSTCSKPMHLTLANVEPWTMNTCPKDHSTTSPKLSHGIQLQQRTHGTLAHFLSKIISSKNRKDDFSRQVYMTVLRNPTSSFGGMVLKFLN